MEAWAVFQLLLPNCHISLISHMQASAVSLADWDAFVFSYSGSTKDMCDTLSIASQRLGVPVILVTHFPENQQEQSLPTVVLQCVWRNESPLQSGSIALKVGQDYFLLTVYFCSSLS